MLQPESWVTLLLMLKFVIPLVLLSLLVHVFSLMSLCRPCNWPFGCCISTLIIRNWIRLNWCWVSTHAYLTLFLFYSLAWFQASAAMLMRSALFSYLTQRRVVIFYRRFGTTYPFQNNIETIRIPGNKGSIAWFDSWKPWNILREWHILK